MNIDLFDWELITVGSKETFLDTIMVKQNDTIHLHLKNGKISKIIKGRKNQSWSYSSILRENQIKKEIDSISNLFVIRQKSPLNVPLIVKSDDFKLSLSQ